MKYRLLFFGLLTLPLFSSCLLKSRPAYPTLEAIADSVRLKYVPDRRDNVYEIAVRDDDGRPVLKGFTSAPEAKVELFERARRENPNVVDSVVLLPDATVGGVVYGVVNVSVADLRTGNDYAAEMATQLLLGTPLRVLQQDGWQRVKTPEDYVAWVEDRQIVRMDENAFRQWTGACKVIFTDDYGYSLEAPDSDRRVSDLVYGNMLRWDGDSGQFYVASYPDGRRAYVPKAQSRLLDGQPTFRPLTEESVVAEALALKGIPYSWGGTSVKAMDCSGFVKIVFLKHGIILRRDASQQAQTGIPVNLDGGYDELRPGDLLFFGKKAVDGRRERIRHVAIYIGEREFIHASGYVRVNSLDPSQPHYDRGNAEELVRASRIIGAIGTYGIWNLTEHPLYQ